MAYRFDIKKLYERRYQIVQAKLYQYKHYGIDEIGKHKNGKYKIKIHWHLKILKELLLS